MIQEFQNRIDKEIEIFSLQLAIPPIELYEPFRYILALGGKRIRPLFVLLACDLFNGEIGKAISASLAMEVFHNFTLVHDDIMDNAPLRRNSPTVHQKWNAPTAILSGDVMLVKACTLITKTPVSENILSLITDIFLSTATQVCEGQQWDLNYERLYRISIAQYFKMIELKTAVLIAASMKIGALIGGADDKNAALLYEFGKNIGMAFQLQDDLLDVYGEEKKFGKQNGGDIISNKKTFLLLKAMEMASANPYIKEELDLWVSIHPTQEKDNNEKISAVKHIYDYFDIKQLTEREILSYYQKATTCLEGVSAATEKKKSLIEFTGKLLARQS